MEMTNLVICNSENLVGTLLAARCSAVADIEGSAIHSVRRYQPGNPH